MNIVNSLEYSGLLLKGFSEMIPNDAENKKEDFLVSY